jgi:hypothetical protein
MEEQVNPSPSPSKAQGGHQTNVEVFVNQQLLKIHNEASGRSKDQRELREQCKELIGARRQARS